MRHLGRHADAFTQRRVRMDGFANVYRVCAHLYSQSHFANQVACIGADDAAAQNLAMAMGFGAVVEQQLGQALGAAVGDDGTA